MILAIDPGPEQSAYVVLSNDYKILDFNKVSNEYLLSKLIVESQNIDTVVIEMIASYGMPVGQEVFETCVWIGRFIQASNCKVERLYRKDVKLHICNSPKANDATITQALKDRFGDKGTVKNKGYFYGFKADIWQAFALGITYLDKQKGN